jgi:hypothetical protein
MKIERNDIKKELYRQKPIAEVWHKNSTDYYYSAYLYGGAKIDFKVPVSDMGEKLFDNEMPAQLLIRYII